MYVLLQYIRLWCYGVQRFLPFLYFWTWISRLSDFDQFLTKVKIMCLLTSCGKVLAIVLLMNDCS